MNVIKRNGDVVEFDSSKIAKAIAKANDKVETQFKLHMLPRDIAREITNDIESREEISVEEIQDLVEKKLYEIGASFELIKEYVTYRYRRSLERDKYNAFISGIKEKLQAKNVKNQNANVDEHSFSGRYGEATNYMTKEIALTTRLSPMARDNHLGNMIYVHDLDHYELGDHNCLTIPFDDLLKNGFEIRQTDIRTARSVDTAFQLLAVIFQLQSLNQFGGVSASHLDHTMVPYVRISFYKHFKDGLKFVEEVADTDKIYESICDSLPIDSEQYKKHEKAYKYALHMTEKETRQAVEGMFHNLNSLQSRAGGQLPFTSINYGTCILPEGRMVIKHLLEANIDGIGKKHRTPIFPCSIFQCMTGVNRKPGDPNYDLFKLALKSTASRLYPNYVNCDWSGNAGYDINDPRTYMSTMGCRTTNGFDINGLGQQKDGRGNICPVTIILPELALQTRDVEKFMELLDKKIHEAKDMLLERFEWICSQSPDCAKFMYNNNVMAGYVPEEGIRSALKHGTIVIGQLGLAECLQALISCDHTDSKGMELAKRIEQLFKDRCAEFKQQYKLNFGVYFTPSENLSYTAMLKLKDKWGVIPNVTDRDWLTNSMHVPVWKKMTPFEKIDIESQLTGYSSAGCITYIELESSCKNNIDALETIVNYAMDKDIPYFAVNVPNDQCSDCGYIDEIGDRCPICNSSNIKRLRRVTGYLTGDYKTAFNFGKQKEVEARVKHA